MNLRSIYSRGEHRRDPFIAPRSNRVLWVAGIFGILCAFYAAELPADTYTVKKKQQEIADTDKEIEAAKSNARKLADELQANRQPISAEGIRLNQWLADLNQRIDSFNSSCAGRQKNASCESTRAALVNEKTQQATAQAANQQQLARMTNLLSEITIANARVQKLRNYRDQLQSNLDEELRMSCAGLSASPSMEEIKNKCGNVQFDGASIGLPPCQTARCREYESH